MADAVVGDPASIADLDATALVGVVESAHRLESMLVARRLAAVAALLRHRVERCERAEGYAVIDGYEQTTAAVAAAMNLSPMAASYLVSHAEALDVRLPKLAALLAEGRTDWRTVRLIISRTDLVTDATVIATLDESLAKRIGTWHGWSQQRIVNAVDAAVRVADPDAARERRTKAEDDRYIGITPQDNRQHTLCHRLEDGSGADANGAVVHQEPAHPAWCERTVHIRRQQVPGIRRVRRPYVSTAASSPGPAAVG